MHSVTFAYAGHVRADLAHIGHDSSSVGVSALFRSDETESDSSSLGEMKTRTWIEKYDDESFHSSLDDDC